ESPHHVPDAVGVLPPCDWRDTSHSDSRDSMVIHAAGALHEAEREAHLAAIQVLPQLTTEQEGTHLLLGEACADHWIAEQPRLVNFAFKQMSQISEITTPVGWTLLE